MDEFRVRIRVEIVPAGETDSSESESSGLDRIDEEAVETVTAAKAVSIDDMEETLLDNAYEVMRRALGRHFTEVSKRGLSTTRCRVSR